VAGFASRAGDGTKVYAERAKGRSGVVVVLHRGEGDSCATMALLATSGADRRPVHRREFAFEQLPAAMTYLDVGRAGARS